MARATASEPALRATSGCPCPFFRPSAQWVPLPPVQRSQPMARPPSAPPAANVADLLARLGDIPARRVRLRPAPGKATEKDLIRIHGREDRLYELVDGALVEKVMGLG